MTILDFFKYGPYRYCFKSLNTLGDILELIKSFEKRGNFFKSIRGKKLSFSHQNGKWNIHQVFRYFTNTERHLICRCPRFVGNGKTVIANLDNIISVGPFKFNQNNFKKLGKKSGKVISNPILLREVFINLLKRIDNIHLGTKSASAVVFPIFGSGIYPMDTIEEKCSSR